MLVSSSDFNLLIQYCSRKLSTKKPCAKTNFNRKKKKINVKTLVKAHTDIMKASNAEKNQTTLFSLELTTPIIRELGGLEIQNKKVSKA